MFVYYIIVASDCFLSFVAIMCSPWPSSSRWQRGGKPLFYHDWQRSTPHSFPRALRLHTSLSQGQSSLATLCNIYILLIFFCYWRCFPPRSFHSFLFCCLCYLTSIIVLLFRCCIMVDKAPSTLRSHRPFTFTSPPVFPRRRLWHTPPQTFANARFCFTMTFFLTSPRFRTIAGNTFIHTTNMEILLRCCAPRIRDVCF